MCVGAVCVRVCVHIRVSVLMAAAGQAQGTWGGSSLVRLLALNRASGRFPFSVFCPRPSPGPPPGGHPSAGLLPAAGGAGPAAPRGCGRPSWEQEPRLQRPRPPFPWGSRAGGLGCCRLVPPQKGRGRKLPGEAEALGSLPLPRPAQRPGVRTAPRESRPCDQALRSRAPGEGCLAGGPGLIPPVPRVRAMTVGKSSRGSPGLPVLGRDQRSEGWA